MAYLGRGVRFAGLERRRAALLLALSGAVWPLGPGSPAAAQRPVVQPLPPPEMAELRTALTRLASDPRDVDALINAGNASLLLEDVDAAIGFFGRAEVLDPGNPRVKLGLAGAYVVSRRPIEALRLFQEAERGGADASLFAAKRGLAFDLVGDNASAQAQYRLALARRDDPRVREQLAISQAVAGDRKGFEATLLPLLKAKDMGAYRTRAFGLAILDREKEAVDLARSVMPGGLAQALTPYLLQIGDLSPVEQVAAVNLGVFPAAASARIASAAAAPAPTIPAAARTAPARPSAPAPRVPVAERMTPAGDPLGRPAGPAATSAMRASSAPAGGTRPAPLPTAGPILSPAPAAAPAPASPARPDFSTVFAGLAPGVAAGPAPGAVDISRLAVPRERPVPPRPAVAAGPATPKPAAASRAGAAPAAKPAAKPGRAPAAEAKPAKPAHPPRHWVQLAAGANRAALAFDWRRLVRAGGKTLAGKEPFVVRWGRTNRLLAGPYPSEKAANEAVRALKAAGVDSLRYDSPEGQEVASLK